MKLKGLAYLVVAVACVAIGAMAGIAGSSAATSHHRAHSAAGGVSGRPPGMGPGLGAVHSVSVVPNREGTGFETVTMDSGEVQSVSGRELTLTEGTKSATYKTVTLTIAADATVELDGKTAQLGELKSGDHAIVCESSGGKSTVMAADSSFQPQRPPAGAHDGPGWLGGPPPGQGQGAPGQEGTEGGGSGG
jgi:hypothetical protein